MPRLVTVVAVEPFPRHADALWNDHQRAELIDYLARNPLAGEEIDETGGLRKLRWHASGRGKRGGARVIYYFYNADHPVFLLTAYAKAQRDDLDAAQRKRLAGFVRELKSVLRARG